jgi:hypothetical protein
MPPWRIRVIEYRVLGLRMLGTDYVIGVNNLVSAAGLFRSVDEAQ